MQRFSIVSNFFNISITYGVGFFLLRSVSFLLLPIYTNLLTSGDAGIVFIIYTVLAFLNPLYAFGMDSALLKFFNLEKYNRKETVSSSLAAAVFSACIFSCFLLALSQYFNFFLNLTFNSLFFISIILFFDSLSSRVLVLLRLLEKPFYYLGVGLINILGSVLLNILFLNYYTLGSFGAIYALTLTSFLQFLCLVPILIKNLHLHFINFKLIKKMFLFGFPFLPSSLLFILTGMSDRWLIKYYLDLNQVGLYGAGYKVGSAISIAVLAFNLSWQPYYLKQYKNTSFALNVNIISNIFFIFLLLLTTGLSLFWPMLIKININGYYLIGEAFWTGGFIIPWVAFGYFFYGMFILQSPSIYLCNKQAWSPVFWLIGGSSNILINVFLIPTLGILGAAISSLFSYLFMFVFIYYKNQLWLKNNFIDTFLVGLGLGSLIIIIVGQYLLYIKVSYVFFFVFCVICCGKLKRIIIKQ